MTRAFVWASLIVGTAVRALPLLDPYGRALRQFASEDGYLMLTIARNLAIGNGLSVENGMTLTNGTQPLMTFVYAGLFWLVGGDKVSGVVLVQALGIAIGLVGAWLLYKVGLRLLHRRRNAAGLAAIAAAAWYVAPIGARYTQNCLETGAAAVLPMGIGLFFLRSSPGPKDRWAVGRCVALGGLLGLAFWVRNDSVFLSAAVCLVLLLSGLRSGAVPIGRRVFEAGTVGTTALAVALPWLTFNYMCFGHVVPVSGISEGAGIPLGHNLSQVPAILVEQISIVALIPGALETVSLVLVLSWAVVLVWSAGAYTYLRQANPAQRQWMAAWSLWALLLVGFYGLIYGAGYFAGRYLYPLSPWMALLTVAMAYRLWEQFGRPSPRTTAAAGLFFILAMSIGLDWRAHRLGMNNGHFQAVEWIEEHVPDTVWVAAVQTGTIGFFHERTYNLDGKVSPAALEARLEDRIFEYVLERPIEYLIDWAGIAGWIEDERLASHFDLLVLDQRRNLAVLRRTTPFEEAPR